MHTTPCNRRATRFSCFFVHKKGEDSKESSPYGVGKRSASRRYNQFTFAAVRPWRIHQELAVQDLPVLKHLHVAKVRIFFHFASIGAKFIVILAQTKKKSSNKTRTNSLINFNSSAKNHLPRNCFYKKSLKNAKFYHFVGMLNNFIYICEQTMLFQQQKENINK